VGFGVDTITSGMSIVIVEQVVTIEAWIPDTLRSFLAHEVGNDGCDGGFCQSPALAISACLYAFVIPDLVSER
jgi:hypothetical protein